MSLFIVIIILFCYCFCYHCYCYSQDWWTCVRSSSAKWTRRCTAAPMQTHLRCLQPSARTSWVCQLHQVSGSFSGYLLNLDLCYLYNDSVKYASWTSSISECLLLITSKNNWTFWLKAFFPCRHKHDGQFRPLGWRIWWSVLWLPVEWSLLHGHVFQPVQKGRYHESKG